MTPLLVMGPVQHFFAPPGRVLQPEPPHPPHDAAQQIPPEPKKPSAHQLRGGAGGAGGGGSGTKHAVASYVLQNLLLLMIWDGQHASAPPDKVLQATLDGEKELGVKAPQ